MSAEKQKTAIWWIRRDLRLEHNQALNAAVKAGFCVIPLFILDPYLLEGSRTGKQRMAFLYGGLQALEARIAQAGGRLILRSGPPEEVLGQVQEEGGVEKIFAERDTSPYSRQRDQLVGSRLPLELVPGLTIAGPEEIKTNQGTPYQVYSYYRKKWKRKLLDGLRQDKAEVIKPAFSQAALDSETLPREPELKNSGLFPPGEGEARERLTNFVEGEGAPIYDYQVDRDRPDRDGTSRLSPYLHLGMIGTQETFQAALRAVDRAGDQAQRQSAETWLDELIWREFYLSILYHHPRVKENNYREEYNLIPWNNDEGDFQRWKEGRTGYPLVDAGMRQLSSIHWMHNRVRMITASFLVKDLLVDWRWGEKWFMEQLLDGDLAANNGGWQWVAGTGTDAAPYFRIFNPTTQAEKHDPDGVYIRRYVPELRPVPDEHLHAPWKMPEDFQIEVGCVIGKDYPEPVIDHAQARERTLEVYQVARQEYSEIKQDR